MLEDLIKYSVEEFYDLVNDSVDKFLADPSSANIECNKSFIAWMTNDDNTFSAYKFNLIEAMGALKTLIRRDRVQGKEFEHVVDLYRQVFGYFYSE